MISKMHNIDEEISDLRKKLSSFLYADRLTASDYEAKKRIENKLFDLLSKKKDANGASREDEEKKQKQREFSQLLKEEKKACLQSIVDHFSNKNRG